MTVIILLHANEHIVLPILVHAQLAVAIQIEIHFVQSLGVVGPLLFGFDMVKQILAHLHLVRLGQVGAQDDGDDFPILLLILHAVMAQQHAPIHLRVLGILTALCQQLAVGVLRLFKLALDLKSGRLVIQRNQRVQPLLAKLVKAAIYDFLDMVDGLRKAVQLGGHVLLTLQKRVGRALQRLQPLDVGLLHGTAPCEKIAGQIQHFFETQVERPNFLQNLFLHLLHGFRAGRLRVQDARRKLLNGGQLFGGAGLPLHHLAQQPRKYVLPGLLIPPQGV